MGQETKQLDSRSNIKTGDLASDLRRQLKQEIDGAELKGPEKFILEQKYGITDAVLLSEEKQTITAEEARLGR